MEIFFFCPNLPGDFKITLKMPILSIVSHRGRIIILITIGGYNEGT